MSTFEYTPIFQHQGIETPWRHITSEGVHTETFKGKEILILEPEILEQLAYEAFCDVSFYLRPEHLKQVAAILDDRDASENDHFVARAFIENSIISAVGELPTCQDT